MANDERATMSRLDVGFARVFLGDTPSQPVNSTKIYFFLNIRIWPFWGAENFLGTDFLWAVKTKRLANLTIGLRIWNPRAESFPMSISEAESEKKIISTLVRSVELVLLKREGK